MFIRCGNSCAKVPFACWCQRNQGNFGSGRRGGASNTCASLRAGAASPRNRRRQFMLYGQAGTFWVQAHLLAWLCKSLPAGVRLLSGRGQACWRASSGASLPEDSLRADLSRGALARARFGGSRGVAVSASLRLELARGLGQAGWPSGVRLDVQSDRVAVIGGDGFISHFVCRGRRQGQRLRLTSHFASAPGAYSGRPLGHLVIGGSADFEIYDERVGVRSLKKVDFFRFRPSADYCRLGSAAIGDGAGPRDGAPDVISLLGCLDSGSNSGIKRE